MIGWIFYFILTIREWNHRRLKKRKFNKNINIIKLIINDLKKFELLFNNKSIIFENSIYNIKNDFKKQIIKNNNIILNNRNELINKLFNIKLNIKNLNEEIEINNKKYTNFLNDIKIDLNDKKIIDDVVKTFIDKNNKFIDNKHLNLLEDIILTNKNLKNELIIENKLINHLEYKLFKIINNKYFYKNKENNLYIFPIKVY